MLLVMTLPLAAVRYPFINYRSSEGLPQGYITALLQDRHGYIWVGTQAGIGKFDGATFETFTSRNGLAGNYITGLEMDHRGDIWVASQDGLSRISSAKISSWPLPDHFIRDIAFNKSDQSLWVLTANSIYTIREGISTPFRQFPDPSRLDGLAACKANGLVFFQSDAVYLLKNQRLQKYPSPEPVNFVKEIDRHLFIGCQGGLYQLNPFGEFKKYSGLPAAIRDITDILFDVQSNLWIASKSGVFYKNLHSGEATVFTVANGLIDDNVHKLLLDRENNIFIGTSFGLSQLSQHLFRMYGIEDGLPSTRVWDILENDGSILLGCDGGIAELKNGRIHAFPINRQLQNKSIRAIVKINAGRYLLGCRNDEILLWNGSGLLQSVYNGVNVLYAIRGSRGNVWFATDNGLLKYDGSGFRWFREGLNDRIVWDVAELAMDTLLVGTRKGLQLFRDGKFIPSRWEQQVGNVAVNDIRVISPREVLVATELDGVFWLKDGLVTRLTQEQGLRHNDVWSVLGDDTGNIWMNSTRALERYGSDSTFTHFNKETGLFGDEGCIHAALKADSGNLYFGIVPGLVEYTFFRNQAPAPMPILVIKDLLINGSPRKIPVTETLHHNQNTIEFNFVCPTTRRESRPVYKTRLFPFDPDWSAFSRSTTVRYTNLPPGTYTFSVQASNSGRGDQWFAAANRVVFTIRSPFWQSWWFRSLQLLAGLGLVFLVVKIRVRVLERQKKKLESLVQKRTNEIAEKNRELAYLSITDPLTDLKNRRYLEEKIKEDISLIRRNLHDLSKGKNKVADKPPLLGIFMLDVDHFKKVNDLYGHEAGDAVIIEIARQLQSMMRQYDTIVRWGGEEFMVITRQSIQGDAFPLAERIRLNIEKTAFSISADQRINKTISIGYTHYPFHIAGQEKFNWQQAVALADNALYLAKHNGRNCVVGITPGSEPFPGTGHELLGNLANAVKNNHLKLISRKNNLKIPVHP